MEQRTGLTRGLAGRTAKRKLPGSRLASRERAGLRGVAGVYDAVGVRVHGVGHGPNDDNPNYIIPVGNVFGFIISIENIL